MDYLTSFIPIYWYSKEGICVMTPMLKDQQQYNSGYNKMPRMVKVNQYNGLFSPLRFPSPFRGNACFCLKL